MRLVNRHDDRVGAEFNSTHNVIVCHEPIMNIYIRNEYIKSTFYSMNFECGKKSMFANHHSFNGALSLKFSLCYYCSSL